MRKLALSNTLSVYQRGYYQVANGEFLDKKNPVGISKEKPVSTMAGQAVSRTIIDTLFETGIGLV